MIDVAARFVIAELNAYLLARTGSPSGGAELGRLVDDAGKLAIKDEQIGVAVVNIEEERALKAQLPDTQYRDGRHVTLQPAIKLNVHLVFAANFKQYDIGLRQLSWVISFFQSHPTFPGDQYPALDRRIERLSADMLSLSYEQLNQLWAVIGCKQVPSVFYRLRLIALQDEEPSAVAIPVTTISTGISRP